MMWMKKNFFVVLFISFASLGNAAEFFILPNTKTLLMMGETIPSDVATLSNYIEKGEVDSLMLKGPGGSLEAGYAIADLVLEHQLNVTIPANTDCASACSLIFVAGKNRKMEELSRLGFHLPFVALGAGYNSEQYCSKIKASPEIEYNADIIVLNTLEEARLILAQIRAGSNFSELAMKFSIAPSGSSNGQLGWFSIGKMVTQFQSAVLDLNVEEISQPVDTIFGWHIIRLNDVRQKRIAAADQAECLMLTYQQGLKDIKRLQKLVLRDGISEKVLDLVIETPSNEMTWVQTNDARKLGLVND